MELFISVIALFFVAYCYGRDRVKKRKEIEQDRQRELEWEREAKQRQQELEEKYRQIDRDYEIGNQIAAKRAAAPMIISLTITEKDTNGKEIGAPKPLSVKLTLDEETATRLVSILHG